MQCSAISQTHEETTIAARLTLLATGAAAEPLMKFGVCQRTEPSATAARVYVEVPARHRQLRSDNC